AVAVGGNVALERTLANARYVLGHAGLGEVPVVAGAAGPIGGDGEGRAGSVHGEDGLAGYGPPLDSGPPSSGAPPSGVPFGGPPLLGVLERFGQPASFDQPAPAHLLAIGPLTNVALALEAEPRLPARLDRLVAMGGAFGSPAGNISPHAEFNFWADPGAAAAVCRAPCPLELVPLDVTEQVALGADALAFLEARLGPSSLACNVVRAGMELHRRQGGVARLPLHDPLAAAVLVEPGLVGEVESGLSVCVEGPERGQVRLVDDEPVHRVALSVDAARAEAAILDALTGD
ncbi:MAG: nucleoside hydrolase, partial [Acidimicrobiales bacterium]|nr:nucleoside hydrolase [Acidimicrobiales bacterium]